MPEFPRHNLTLEKQSATLSGFLSPRVLVPVGRGLSNDFDPAAWWLGEAGSLGASEPLMVGAGQLRCVSFYSDIWTSGTLQTLERLPPSAS